jgi:hypothetical protein
MMMFNRNRIEIPEIKSRIRTEYFTGDNKKQGS